MHSFAGLRNAGLIALAVLSGWTVAARAEEPKVVITGGADQTQHQYTWQVTNRSDSRIVRVEFPHYAADLFSTPDTWKQGTGEEMGLVGYGGSSGVAWAEPDPPYPGLAPGSTATFGMRISSRGALKGTGTVRVKFDDGTEAEVPGVELPEMPARTSPYLAPVVMGALLLVFIFVREYRRRKNPPAATNWSDDEPSA